MRRRTFLVAALAGALIATDAAAAEQAPVTKGSGVKAQGTKPGGAKFVGADEIKFQDVPDMKGVSLSVLWGDPQKSGDWGGLIKFAPGTEVPWHTHTNALKLVMISGTLQVDTRDGTHDLAASAYAAESPKVPHRSVCKGGSDCVFLVHQHGKFDVVPTKEPKAAKGGKAAAAPAR